MNFHDHDIIITTKRVRDDQQMIQAGSIGTIIHLHELNPGRAQVEFEGGVIAVVPFTKMRPEFTCVYCGCTDSRACAGGCSWIETHEHTPTGVCSNCIGRTAWNDAPAAALIIRTLRRQKTCLEKNVLKMEQDAKEVHAGQRVIRWATRFSKNGTHWEQDQLRRAVNAFSKLSTKDSQP